MGTTRFSRKFMKDFNIVVILMMLVSQVGWRVNRVAADTPNPPVITEGNSTSVTMSQNGSPTAFDVALHATDADVQAVNTPNPYFDVRANDNQVEAHEWPLGHIVTLEIDDPGTPLLNPDYSDTRTVIVNPKDPSQTYAEFNLKGVFDIQPGFLVRMNDGTTSKTHTVTNLAFTNYDLDLDTVSGIAGADSHVDVWACDSSNCYNRHVDADGDGNWTADFAHVGAQGDEQTTFDIVPGTNVDSSQCDEDGDRTLFGWRVPNPNFNVRANDDRVEAWEWPLGYTVTLEIDDPGTALLNPDYTDTRTVAVFPKDPSQTYAEFNLKGVFDIQPGFLVRMNDGTTSKTHTVTSLAFTDYDLDLDTVSGIAAPGSHVDVWAYDSSNFYNRHVDTDGDGNWTADFAHVSTQGDEQTTFDIVPGINVDSSQCDGDGDRTLFGMNIPNPSIQANPSPGKGWIHAHAWPLGKVLTLTIDDPSNGVGVDYTGTATVENPDIPGDPNQNLANFDWPDQFPRGPGYVITIKGDTLGGPVTKTLIVADLRVLSADPVTDIISGVATPGVPTVEVCLWRPVSNCFWLYPSVNATTGAWNADYSAQDLVPDDSGWVTEYDPDSDSTWYYWGIPNPRFDVRASDDRVEAYEWPLGHTVTLEINNPGTPQNPDYTITQTVGILPKDPSQTYAAFNLNGVFDIQPGFVVKLKDGTTTKTHIVTGLAVTGYDLDLDTVTGVAALGSRIDVWVCDSSNCYNRHVNADGDGNWTADFAHKGTEGDEQDIFNIVPGSKGDAGQCDADGDCTRFGWSVNNPIIDTVLFNNQMYGEEWPLGVSLTVTVDDPGTIPLVDFTDSSTVVATPYDPNRTQVTFEMGEFKLQPGQTVTMTDGHTTKIQIVSNILVTNVNAATDVVSGTAEPNTDVFVGVWSQDGAKRSVLTDPSGHWFADFSITGSGEGEQNPFDILPGQMGEAAQYDEDGDRTRYAWSAPNPRFDVRANEDRVEAFEWPLADTVMLTIDDPGTTKNPDYTDTRSVGVAPWDPRQTYAEFNLRGTFDIQPGFLVSMSDGNTTKTHTVTGLAITGFDPDKDLVNGVAGAGARVDLGTCDKEKKNCAKRHVTADGVGNWTADFAHPGAEGDEQDTIDIVPGTGVDSGECDADGDCSHFSMNAPNPSFIVRANWDQVESYGWTLGDTVTLTIDDPGTGKDPDFTGTQTIGLMPEDSSQTYAKFDLGTILDIQPGFQVNLSDGTITKTHTVTGLEFTGFDLENDLVNGVASAGSRVDVWACDDDKNCTNRHVTADGAGNWTADYAHKGTQGDEQNTFDIVQGTWVDSSQCDADGDCTQYGTSTYNPFITAYPTENIVKGEDFPSGAEVTLTIDDPTNGIGTDVTLTGVVDQKGGACTGWCVEFNLPGEFQLAGGQVVTLAYDTNSISYTVSNLKLKKVNVQNDIVSGTADPFSLVTLVMWFRDVNRYVTTDKNGNWSADFSIPGSGADEKGTCDLSEDSLCVGMILQGDDPIPLNSNRTRINWSIPNPHFVVRANEVRVEAYEWTLADTVSLAIDIPGNSQNPDYTDTRTVSVMPKDPSQTYAEFDLKGTFDIQPGYVVSLSDGTLIKTYTVTGLAVTSYDLALDTVSGVAAASSAVNLWACDNKNCSNRHVTTNGTGHWTADFAHPGMQEDEQNTFDIAPGTWIDSKQCDEQGDCTQFGINVPNPSFIVRANEDRVEAYEWTMGNTITLAIDDPLTVKNPDYTDTRTVGPMPKDPSQSYAEFNLKGVFDIQPGFVVSMSDGTITKTHTVTGLAFTGYNIVLDTVTGAAAADSAVNLWACDDTHCTNRHVAASGTGHWTADFAHPGTQGDEQTTFDLVRGTWIDSSQCDPDGDCTQFGMNIPNPRFDVRANEDRVEVYEWTQGQNVTLAIDDPQTVKNPDYTDTQTVGSMPKDPSQTYTEFNLKGIFDIQSGFLVSLSDGTITKTHIVTNLVVTSVDLEEDLVNGVGAPGVRVDIWASDGENWYDRHVNADGSGIWTGDFAHKGTEGDEQTTFDIVRGSNGDTRQCDADGDCTRSGWGVPFLYMVFLPLVVR